MRVAILHQAVPKDAAPDELDVLVQVEAVSQALHELGHSTSVVPCTLALDEVRRQLQDERPDLVFNLVESLGGTDSLQPIVPLIVESLGIPMTGSSAAAILNSGRKDFAKLMLERYELLYEAGLVREAQRDRNLTPAGGATQPLGADMVFDHRRILSTAMGRLRAKMKYRPVVFELMPPEFTLLELQRTVEAISGIRLHKQNFRRLVEGQGLVEYALILVLVAVVVIVILALLGPAIGNIFSNIVNAL